MRITSGTYKNRRLFVPDGKFVRPTSDRMRQSIFNILRHPKWAPDFSLDGAHIADLFCGSGSLGLEALSNGAKHCVFVDQDVKAVTNNTGFLDDDDFQIIKSSLPKVSRIPTKQFDLVFMDPPYDQNLVEPTIQLLMNNNHLANDAIIVIETEKGLNLNIDLELMDKRTQSNSDLWMYRCQ
jgi:16S rRNA (guanine966-N2)-methyltransferase